MSRIEEATLLEDASERPPDFDLAAYWKSSTQQYNERPRYEVTLRLAPQAVQRVKEWRMAVPESIPDADGWVTAHIPFDDEEQALFVVLGFGARADVIKPAGLRERVKGEIAAAGQRLSHQESARQNMPQVTIVAKAGPTNAAGRAG